jgi:phosphogluconate dehydratase
LRSAADPFSPEGGLKLLHGNLGRAMMKVAAVARKHRIVEAPAIVFDSQEAFLAAFKRGALEKDCIAVLRFQGPRANGMPELHKLTPALSVLQDKGFKVGLLTDGRMSGASGKVPAALHLTPEAVDGGVIARLVDGDIIRIDGERGTLDVKAERATLMARAPAMHRAVNKGLGRELFAAFRATVGPADQGASLFHPETTRVSEPVRA